MDSRYQFCMNEIITDSREKQSVYHHYNEAIIFIDDIFKTEKMMKIIKEYSNTLKAYVKILLCCMAFAVLLWPNQAKAADCGEGIKTCICGDTVRTSITLTYNLDCTNSNSHGLIVGASNITIDGKDNNGIFHTITGDGTGDGTTYRYSGITNIDSDVTATNFTVRNVKISNFKNGIYLQNTINSTIDGVNASNNGSGIALVSSNSNTLSYNTINLNDTGIYLLSSDSNTLNDNIVSKNNKTIEDSWTTNVFLRNQFLNNINIDSKMLTFTENPRTVKLNEPVSFDIWMFDAKGAPCPFPTCTYTITTSPYEPLEHAPAGNEVTGSFTPTKTGMYSLTFTIKDNNNNITKRSYRYFVNNATGSLASAVTTIYYLRGGSPTHGQPYGNGRDSQSCLLSKPTYTETWWCLNWTQHSPDELPDYPLSYVTEIDIGTWYVLGADGFLGIQRSVTFDDYYYSLPDDSIVQLASASSYTWFNTNFTNLTWAMDNLENWYWLGVKLFGKPVYGQTRAAQPSYAAFTHTYMTTPSIKSISNPDIILLSATAPNNDPGSASIVLENPLSSAATTTLTLADFQHPFSVDTSDVTIQSAIIPGGTTTVTVSFAANDANRTITLNSMAIDIPPLNKCTIATCNSIGTCVDTPISCDDNNVCTTDTCNTATGCIHVNNTSACDDKNSCTTNDICSGGVCIGSPKSCDDGNACITDICNLTTGVCFYTIDDTWTCNDNNVCTDDSCNPAIGCVYTPNNAACNDNNACTSGDSCSGGNCSGTAIVCVDGNICTDDSCDPAIGCMHDALPNCGGPGTPLTCTTLGIETGSGSAPNTPCTTGSCFGMEVYLGYVVWADFGPGADGGFVTGKDQADSELSNTWNFFGADGTFNTTPGGNSNLFDANSCGGRMCSNKTEFKVFNMFWNGITIPVGSAAGCVHPNCTSDQKDGVFVSDYQINGGIWSMHYSQVVPSGQYVGVRFSMIVRGTVAATRCNDNDACTTDTCDPATGACAHTTVVCNDNNACTTDGCNPASGCYDMPMVCNDNDACTIDKCAPATGCYFQPALTDDGDPCTIDACDPSTGVITHTPIICNDNNACTSDACVNGICVSTLAIVCDDNNPCTSDSCDPATGSCTYSPLADGSSCTVGTLTGTCSVGICDICPVGSVKSVVIRGGGGSASGADLQIQTSFTVMNAAGCITSSMDNSITVTPGTIMQVNIRAGLGPHPTSATWQGNSIATDCNFMITCPDAIGEAGKLILDNTAADGGQDTDRITISVL